MAAVVSSAVPIAWTPQPPSQTSSIIRQIDPLLIASSEATELLLLLSDTFQLPVAWTLTDYGGFSSGGVAGVTSTWRFPSPSKKKFPIS
jgi:hypothetical protein